MTITTALNGALNDSSTTITVITTTNFESSGHVLIDAELVSYSSKTSTTFTGCVRGIGNTVPASHSSAVTTYQYYRDVCIDDDPLYHTDKSPNVDNRVHSGSITRILLHPVKVDTDYQKEIKFIRVPSVAKSSRAANPITTFGLDFCRITEVYTITGYVKDDSSQWGSSAPYDSNTRDNAMLSRDDLITMIEAGGQVHLNYGINNGIDVMFSKVKFSQSASDSDVPSKYGLNLVMVYATNR